MKSAVKSVVCLVGKNLPFVFSNLKMCLKNRQINEPRQKQGKIPPSRNFPAGLSTETVDAFPLALPHIALQPAKESRFA
ncbi:MAG: hypothetical protein ACRC6I_11220 [Paracoccaceae bacterium]